MNKKRYFLVGLLVVLVVAVVLFASGVFKEIKSR